MNFKSNERIAILIDGPNLYATTRALDISLDFSRILTLFQKQAHLIRALYYTAITEDSTLHPMMDWLEYNGFSVITKPAKEYVDENGRRRVKGNIEIEIAVDAMRLAPHVDHIIIFSGNGDFTAAVSAIQQLGRRVSVVSTLQTQPAMVSDELRRQVDQFIDIVDIEDKVARAPAAASR